MDQHFDQEREQLEQVIKKMYKELETTDTSFIINYKDELVRFLDSFEDLEQEIQRLAIHDLIDQITIFKDHVDIKLPISHTNTKIKSTSIKRGTMFF